MLGSHPAGNILLSCAILFAGANVAQTFRVMQNINLQIFDYRTFFTHQNDFLQPAILHLWNTEQKKNIQVVEKLQTKDAIGDGRTDSPGFSGHNGLYTLAIHELNLILDVELVQVSINHKNI